MTSKFKLLVVSALSVICVSNSVNAQVFEDDLKKFSNNYFEAGAKLGANYQQLSGNPFTTTYNPGAIAGAYIKKRGEILGLQLELNLTTAKYSTEYAVYHKFEPSRVKYSDTTTKADFNSIYANIPLIIEVRPGRHFAFQFGAQYSYLLSNTESNGVFTKRYGTEEILNKTSVSVLTGFELDICKDFRLGARYTMGFSDMNAGKYVPLNDKWQNNSLQVCLIYRFKKFGIKI